MRYSFLVFFLLVLVASCQTTRKAECGNSPSSFGCVQYVSNYDGDTVTFNIKGLHPLFGHHIAVRIKGVDTPELKSSNPCEKSLAVTAKDYVANILRNADSINLVNIERGKYFRVLSDIMVDGSSLADSLLRNNLAVRYDGGKKKHEWLCSTTIR